MGGILPPPRLSKIPTRLTCQRKEEGGNLPLHFPPGFISPHVSNPFLGRWSFCVCTHAFLRGTMGCHFAVSPFGGPFLHFQGENIKNSGKKLRSSMGGEGAGAEFFTPILFVSPPFFPVPSWPPLEWEGRRGNRLHHCLSPFSLSFFFRGCGGNHFTVGNFGRKNFFSLLAPI